MKTTHERRFLILLATTALLLTTACGDDDGADAGDTQSDVVVDTTADVTNRMCPSHLRFENIRDVSQIDTGFSGLVHNFRSGAFPFTTEVTDCDDACETCRFEGPREDSEYISRRCIANTRIACASDDDCADEADSRCRYMYGWPLSGGAFPIGLCIQSYFPSPEDPLSGGLPAIAGRINLRTGEVTISRLAFATTSNALGADFAGTCMECLPSASGGRTCQPAVAANLPPGYATDAMAIERFNGMPCEPREPVTGAIPGTFSLDCPMGRVNPSLSFDLQGSGNGLSTGGYRVELTEESPNCTSPDFAGEKCWCGVCTTGSGEVSRRACMTTSDCELGETCGGLPADCNPNPPALIAGGGGVMPNPMHDSRYAPYECRGASPPPPGEMVPFASRTGVIATAPHDCVNDCAYDESTGEGVCISARTGTRVGCYPNDIGTVVSVEGKTELRNEEYFIDTGFIQCAAPRPPPTLLNGYIGYPGLDVQHRAFRVSLEER